MCLHFTADTALRHASQHDRAYCILPVRRFEHKLLAALQSNRRFCSGIVDYDQHFGHGYHIAEGLVRFRVLHIRSL